MMQTSTLSETKRRLLEAMLRGESAKAFAHPRIERRRLSDLPRLGPAQEQVWCRSVRAREAPPLYNESITVYREGPFDVQVLERCFGEILCRHEVWRTSFQSVNGVTVQVVDPAPAAPKIQLIDLRAFPAEHRGPEATRLVSELAQQRFDLERGPLLRTLLLRMGETSYRFMIIAHQSIVDGVSVYQVLPTELASLYDAFSAGRPSPLPDLPLQYADFSNWQRRWLQGDNLETQKAFWKRKLAPPLPVLAWPKDRPQPTGDTYRGAIRSFDVPETLNIAIRELAQRERVTLFTILLAGFTALMHHYTGQSDILVGTLSPSGRKRLETQKLLGYFLNPVALRFDVSAEPTFHELLDQTRLLVAEAISHDDLPLENLAAELKIDTRRDPFVKIAISLQPQVPRLVGWNVTSMDAQNGGSAWDLYLAFIEGDGGLIGRVQFNPDGFGEDTITAMLEDLWQLLDEVTKHPAKRVSELLRQ